jgi:tRNA-2-methylthio-N6-dimethylallyladenosine synthase
MTTLASPSTKPPATATDGRAVHIETFGCQMNVLDSELVADQLRALGYRFVDAPAEADIVLYNTCSVRDLSEQKVLSRIGTMRKRKEGAPDVGHRDVVVGVLGCMAERAGEGLANKYGTIDLMVGPSELDQVPALLENIRVQRAEGQAASAAIALSGHNARRKKTHDAATDRLEALDAGRYVDPDVKGRQAYVRITRGCNKFCAFCVVPYTRGEEVHRPADAIVDEVKRLVDTGAQEVTLLGQTINHYEHDGTSFARLLQRVHDEVPDLARLRFLTSYPRDFTDEALDVMASSERMCRFLHIPAQSGNDRVLKRMNRGYTRGEYLDLIGRAKERMPDVSILGDMIVGFPTETDDEFEDSLSLLREVRYKSVFVFKYSPRPGTVAIKKLDDDVPDAVKKERNQRMLALQQ